MGLAQPALEIAPDKRRAVRKILFALLRFLDFFRNRLKALLDREAMEV